jgi:hypothetical protein
LLFYIYKAVEIDNELYEKKLEKEKRKATRSLFREDPRLNQAVPRERFTKNGKDLMELDNLQRKPWKNKKRPENTGNNEAS